MLIKASHITNLTDARYFAAREVQFLGFNLEEGTDDYLDPIYMRAIREWVEGPVIVGEFGRTDTAGVAAAAAFFGLAAVEVQAPAAALEALDGLTVLLDVSALAGDEAGLASTMAAAAPHVAYFTVRFGRADNSWRAPYWSRLCAQFPVLVEFDLPAAEWRAAVDALQPAGLCLRGGAEEKVGIKSFDEIEAIFEALEA